MGAGAGFQADSNAEWPKNSIHILIKRHLRTRNYSKVQQGFFFWGGKKKLDRSFKDGITEEELKNAVNGWVQEENDLPSQRIRTGWSGKQQHYYGRTKMDFQKTWKKKVKI